MNAILALWEDAWTPERATGLQWSALLGGHVFVGMLLGTAFLNFTTLNPYLIDVGVFLGYLLFKEGFDYMRSKDWRDGLIDSLGVGFGAYTLTSVVLCDMGAAFWTSTMAAVVAIYGYIHTRENKEDVR